MLIFCLNPHSRWIRFRFDVRGKQCKRTRNFSIDNFFSYQKRRKFFSCFEHNRKSALIFHECFQWESFSQYDVRVVKRKWRKKLEKEFVSLPSGTENCPKRKLLNIEIKLNNHPGCVLYHLFISPLALTGCF